MTERDYQTEEEKISEFGKHLDPDDSGNDCCSGNPHDGSPERED